MESFAGGQGDVAELRLYDGLRLCGFGPALTASLFSGLGSNDETPVTVTSPNAGSLLAVVVVVGLARAL